MIFLAPKIELVEVGTVGPECIVGEGAFEFGKDLVNHGIVPYINQFSQKDAQSITNGNIMISAGQIKAARAMLGWSATELAENSGVGSATVKRYELQEGIPQATTKVLMAIKTTLEGEGIEFTGDPLVNPGVMLNLASHQDKLPPFFVQQ